MLTWLLALSGAFGSLLAADYYERLGVKRDASLRDIRQGFKRLALQMHPDKNPSDPDAHAKMVELNLALMVLGDPASRAKYDKFGEAGLRDSKVRHDDAHQPYNFYQNFGMFDDEPAVEYVDYMSWEADHSNQDAWLIVFVVPNCPDCESMSEEWRIVARRLQHVVHVAYCDCDRAFPVCRQLGLTHAPTIVLFPKGQKRGLQHPLFYEGAMNERDITNFALSHLPASVQTLGAQDFRRNSPLPYGGAQGTVWVVGYCQSECTDVNLKLRQIEAIISGFVPVVMVDCAQASEACTDVQSDIPVFVVYDHGEHSNYRGLDASPQEIAQKALKGLPKLGVLDVTTLESVAEVALSEAEGKHVSRTSKGNGKEYLVLFTNQDKCEDDEGLGPMTSLCYKALLALRRVHNTLASDWQYGDLVVTTFSCHYSDLSDLRRKRICDDFKITGDKPTLMHFEDKGLNPSRFHDRVDRSNQILGFVEEVFRSMIHEVTKQDFEQHVVKEKQTWYISFYAPWCHHCRDVFPEWNAASKNPNLPSNINIHFGKIDCAAHLDTCQEHHIRAYPSFLLFHNGVRHQFDLDHRTAEEFVRFAKQELEPIVYEFDIDLYKNSFYNPDTRESHVGADSWIVKFFAPWCSHCQTIAPKYFEAAKALRGVVKFGKFNCELDAQFCGRLGINFLPTLWKFDPTNHDWSKPKAELTGTPDARAILEFAVADIRDNVVQDLTVENFRATVFSDQTELLWVVYFYSSKDGECKACKDTEPKIKALAARYIEREIETLKSARSDPVAGAQPVFVRFGRFDCRASGEAYTLCLSEKVKKFPNVVYFSGATGDKNLVKHEDMLELMSQIDRRLDLDRRELSSPFLGDPYSWRYRHNEL